MPADFSVDPEIARAWTLPAEIYEDPDHFAVQKERVFARSWHLLPDTSDLKAPGHVRPFTLLKGCLDEPLLLTRDTDDRLHCLSNVCTHRGALVVEGEGHVKSLRCRYHGRKFGLDGCFRFMPEFEEAEDFPADSDDLPSLPVEEYGPFRFTSLDPAFSFEEWLAPVRARTDFLPLNEARFDAETSRDYPVDANWALYVDNYLEGFHVPYVHPESLGGLDYGGYRTEPSELGVLQTGLGKEGEPTFDLPADHPDAGDRVSAFYFFLFPNFMLNFYPWGVSVNVVRPRGPHRCTVSFLTWLWDEGLPESGVGSHLHRVEMEDEEVVASVQKGVRSRLYDRGRYSPKREKGPHRFHRMLAEFMTESS